MRIVILANVPVWTLPGLEHLFRAGHYATWLEPLIPEFEKYEDIDIHWITICRETSIPLEHSAYGQTFHILPRRCKMSISIVTGFYLERRQISKVLRKLEPDVLHAWGSEDVYGLAGALSGIEKRLFTLQGCLNHLKLLEKSILFRLLAQYERPSVSRYPVGSAESQRACDLLQGLNPRMDVRKIEYGVNSEFFEAEWNPSASPTLIFIGSINMRKGICDFLKMAERKEFAHIKFLIAGDGGIKSEIELSSPPNVEWLGRCERLKVIEHISRSWGLVIPTYSDTGPTVVKEARVVGLPVITTTSAGAACYVESGENGFVIEPGDTEALAVAIAELCASRENCLKMGQVNWEEQRELLRPSNTAQNFIDIYQNL